MPLLPLASASRLIASRRIDRHAISERAPESERALIPFPRHAPPRRGTAAALSRLMAEIVALMASVGHAFPNLPIAILSWLIAEFFSGCAAYAEAMYPIVPPVHDPVDRGDPVPPAAPPLPNRPSRARPSLKLVPATCPSTGHAERWALNELADVDDRTLRDIGRCRGEIEIAVRQEGYSG
jgi:Domain of unknown function (DUF1127)